MADSADRTLLRASKLSMKLGRLQLLEEVSLSVSEGEIVTVIGPNGAGKTTLLRGLLGLLPPSSGSVVKRPRLRIGYLPQRLTVDPVLPFSVARMMTLTASFPRKQIRLALEETGVAHLIDESVQGLSGGEFQRMMRARTLLGNPELLGREEPVQGVDYMGEAEFYELIGRLRNQHGCGVLMVSHDLHVVMASTDRVVCLNRHVCCEGQPQEVSLHPEYLRLFGLESSAALAVYTHQHDHTHRLSGAVHPEAHHAETEAGGESP